MIACLNEYWSVWACVSAIARHSLYIFIDIYTCIMYMYIYIYMYIDACICCVYIYIYYMYFEQWVRAGKLVKSQLSQLVSIFHPFSRKFCECKQIYKMIKIWRQVFFVTWFDRNVSFPNCNWIQKSLQRFNQNFKVSLSVVWILLSCSINVNFAWRLNECPGFLKWKLGGIDFGLFTSFLWLFNLILKAVSAFQTYWILHNLHFIKPMINLFLRFCYVKT